MLHNLFQIFLRIKRILTSPLFVRGSDMIKKSDAPCAEHISAGQTTIGTIRYLVLLEMFCFTFA